MSRLSFIEVHKLSATGSTTEPTPALLNVCSIQSITESDANDRCVIQLVGRDQTPFTVFDNFKVVSAAIDRATGKKQGWATEAVTRG